MFRDGSFRRKLSQVAAIGGVAASAVACATPVESPAKVASEEPTKVKVAMVVPTPAVELAKTVVPEVSREKEITAEEIQAIVKFLRFAGKEYQPYYKGKYNVLSWEGREDDKRSIENDMYADVARSLKMGISPEILSRILKENKVALTDAKVSLAVPGALEISKLGVRSVTHEFGHKLALFEQGGLSEAVAAWYTEYVGGTLTGKAEFKGCGVVAGGYDYEGGQGELMRVMNKLVADGLIKEQKDFFLMLVDVYWGDAQKGLLKPGEPMKMGRLEHGLSGRFGVKQEVVRGWFDKPAFNCAFAPY